jgi:dTDP-4-dehydrorhamnose reductase
MKILITGKTGQLGQSIQKILNYDSSFRNTFNHINFFFVGKEELDLERPKEVDNYFNKNSFDIIVNCAAFTAVDLAEENKELANRVNHLAVKQLAEISKDKKMKLIHISTDYVFDGKTKKKYTEDDITNPLNTYGQTKLYGEKSIKKIMKKNAIIIRTSWVYSEYKKNFLDTMLMLAKSREKLNVVSDQIGSPTYASDLAKLLLVIISKNFNENRTKIYHFCNGGQASWHEFAVEIFKLSEINCKVIPIKSIDYHFQAQRPRNSVMSTEKVFRDLQVEIPSWQKSLARCINAIKSNNV